MPPPLAYFLTWTCYGQRLHGDPRGSVDDSHNKLGTPYLPPDPAREGRERRQMNVPLVTLSSEMVAVVDRAITQLGAEREWLLLAKGVRSTHVHVVCNGRSSASPERAMTDFKARGTKDLRDAGLAALDTVLWTEHGSTRWINHARGLYAAISYVNDWQSGVNRELLEQRKVLLRAKLKEVRRWIDSSAVNG